MYSISAVDDGPASSHFSRRRWVLAKFRSELSFQRLSALHLIVKRWFPQFSSAGSLPSLILLPLPLAIWWQPSLRRFPEYGCRWEGCRSRCHYHSFRLFSSFSPTERRVRWCFRETNYGPRHRQLPCGFHLFYVPLCSIRCQYRPSRIR